jgi:hypothetical protein
VAPPPPRVATSLPLAARSPSTWPTMIMTGMSNHCNDPTVGSSNGLDEWLNKNKAYPSTLSVHVHGDDTVWDDYGRRHDRCTLYMDSEPHGGGRSERLSVRALNLYALTLR